MSSLLDRALRRLRLSQQGHRTIATIEPPPPATPHTTPAEFTDEDRTTSEPTPDEPVPFDGKDRPSRLGPWLDVTAEELAATPQALESLYDGRIDGFTVRGVFEPDEMRSAVERLEHWRNEMLDFTFVQMLGTAIVGSDPDRDDYHQRVELASRFLPDLFTTDFSARISAVLSQAAGGRPAQVPVDDQSREYAPATLRVLPPGPGVMNAHTANEFCNVWDAYSHLRSIARMWNSLSYFITVQAPTEGGELTLYDLIWDETPDEVLERSMSPERDVVMSGFRTVPVAPGPGDMILFCGGRVWHRVAPVGGDTARITCGGFAALSSDADKVYYWS